MTVLRNKNQLHITQSSCNTLWNMNDVIKTSEERRELSYKEQQSLLKVRASSLLLTNSLTPHLALECLFLESRMTTGLSKLTWRVYPWFRGIKLLCEDCLEFSEQPWNKHHVLKKKKVFFSREVSYFHREAPAWDIFVCLAKERVIRVRLSGSQLISMTG